MGDHQFTDVSAYEDIGTYDTPVHKEIYDRHKEYTRHNKPHRHLPVTIKQAWKPPYDQHYVQKDHTGT